MSNGAASRPLTGRIAGQGALLFSGFAVGLACQFIRNAFLGHWLAKGDFGVAATLTLTLQLLEVLSDLGADRLIVQDRDGDDKRLMATAHLVLFARGVALALALYLGAGAIATFFGAPESAWALQVIALVPLVKGVQHLDMRRRQRHLDNGPYMIIDAAPQVLALLLLPVMLKWTPGFAAVAWLALVQAATAVALSHVMAQRPYRVGLDMPFLHRLLKFGWPVWLSAIPIIAVYHGDRIIVGRLMGIEVLAGLSAAFMLTMVPSMVAAKAGPAIMLPLLSEMRDAPAKFAARVHMMSALVLAWGAAYLAGFVVAGGAAVEIAFGPNYKGLAAVVAWLAAMWAIRMVQSVPGMALMAIGRTRPLFEGGILRALALAPSAALATGGYGLEAVVAAGVAGEAVAGGYLIWCVNRQWPGLGRDLARQSLVLFPVVLAALLVAPTLTGLSLTMQLLCGGGAALIAGAFALIVDRDIRSSILQAKVPEDRVAALSAAA